MSLRTRAVRKIGLAAAVLVLVLSGWRAEARVARSRPAAKPSGVSATIQSIWSWLTSLFLPGAPNNPGAHPTGAHGEIGCGMDPNGGMNGMGECPQMFRPGEGSKEGSSPPEKR